jgi:hypothetical protein
LDVLRRETYREAREAVDWLRIVLSSSPALPILPGLDYVMEDGPVSVVFSVDLDGQPSVNALWVRPPREWHGFESNEFVLVPEDDPAAYYLLRWIRGYRPDGKRRHNTMPPRIYLPSASPRPPEAYVRRRRGTRRPRR